MKFEIITLTRNRYRNISGPGHKRLTMEVKSVPEFYVAIRERLTRVEGGEGNFFGNRCFDLSAIPGHIRYCCAKFFDKYIARRN
mgnify:CR=1 FL=1